MGFVCNVPGCAFTWLPEWVAHLCPLGVVGGVVCGDPVGVSTNVVLGDPRGFPTKYAPIKDEPIRVVVCHLLCLNGERTGTPRSNGGRSKKRLYRQGPIGSIMMSTRFNFGNIF